MTEKAVMEMERTVSLIENVNLQQVQATMDKIQRFQAVVQRTLKLDHDYGKIPGTGSKPTLLKPGAEKILMLMGLTSEYEITERVQDYDAGFFAFTVKCTLSKNGLKVTEGVGHANTREKRYTSGNQQDAYTLANTVLKMAKKRAQVDAALTVASLSEIFTQDLEDFSPAEQPNEKRPSSPKPKSNGNGNLATEAQCKAIYAISKNHGMSDDEVKEMIMAKYGKESSKDLTKKEASALIDELQKEEE